ncbi:hypothetical protein AB0J52_06130 [Spirillospora sp. NPDC049652]
MDDVNELLAELKALRKGFGLDDPKALLRIGPSLRLAARVTDADDATATRTKVRWFLHQALAPLSAREASAITVGLALDGSGDRRLEARLTRLGRETGCDPRTVRRHLDATLLKVAEQTCAVSPLENLPRAEPSWLIRQLDAHVRLGPSSTEIREARDLVSQEDGLREVGFSYSVGEPAADPDGVPIEVLRGGVVIARERCSATRTRVRVGLPHPLGRGEAHGVALKIVVPHPLPFYVCTPQHRCARFDLTVDFGSSVPERVWVVEDELALEAGDPRRARCPVRLDATGRAAASFAHLSPQRSYGLAWSTGWSTSSAV